MKSDHCWEQTALELSGSEEKAAPGKEGRAIKLYLREIGQVEQLTPQEEIDLLTKAKRGDRKARQRLIRAGLRRVVQISREYENIGLSLLDLISEGNVGLLKAIERFDRAKVDEFPTHCAWWIKQSIKRALAQQSRTLRVDFTQPARGPVGAVRQCGIDGQDDPLVPGRSEMSAPDSQHLAVLRG